MKKSTRLGQTACLILLLMCLFPRMLGNAVLPADLCADHGGRLVRIQLMSAKYTTTETGCFVAYALEPHSIIGWNRGLSPRLEFA